MPGAESSAQGGGGRARIVLVSLYYAPDDAAAAQILADVGERLAAAGHEVVALCSDRAYADPSRRYPARETIAGVEIRRVRTTGFGRGSKLGRVVDYATFLGTAAGRLLLGPGADVIVSLSTPPMLPALAAFAASVRRARSLYWVMDVYPELAFELGVVGRGSAMASILRSISRYSLLRSDRVVALDEVMAERLRASGARDPVVIHNWADGETIRPRPVAGHSLRADWGWEGKFVALYSGNMGLAHEFDTLLRAAEILAGRDDIRFAFVGGGPRRREVEEEVRRRGLGNVEFRPYQPRDRLGESLTAGNVHLITLRERMAGLVVPSKIYGVLAAGRPTLYVGPPEGAVHDIVSGEACGACLAGGDAQGLADAIAARAADPGLARAEGERARQAFEARFTLAHGTGAFMDLLLETARPGGIRRAPGTAPDGRGGI